MSVPDSLLFTSDHEWVLDDDPVSVGLSAYAVDALGDIVYVGLPAVGEHLVAGIACGEVESTKSVSDLYAPVSGTVVAVNLALADEPGLMNEDPYGRGWMFQVRVDGPLLELLTAAAYRALINEGPATA